MNRYLITNPEWKGEVDVLYKDGILSRIDFLQIAIATENLRRLKGAIPIYEADLQKQFPSDTIIVAAEFDVTFEMFWNRYGDKINKKRAEGLWEKMSKSERVAAWASIAAYDRFLARPQNKWRPKADPDTYLRNRYYENEYK